MLVTFLQCESSVQRECFDTYRSAYKTSSKSVTVVASLDYISPIRTKATKKKTKKNTQTHTHEITCSRAISHET